MKHSVMIELYFMIFRTRRKSKVPMVAFCKSIVRRNGKSGGLVNGGLIAALIDKTFRKKMFVLESISQRKCMS